MKNNLRRRNPFIHHAEVLLVLYRYYYPPVSGGKRKFNREDKPRENIRSNKKANPKVEIHDLLRNALHQCHLEIQYESTLQGSGKLMKHPHFRAIKGRQVMHHWHDPEMLQPLLQEDSPQYHI